MSVVAKSAIAAADAAAKPRLSRAATSDWRDWREAPERSNWLAVKFMAWIAVHLGRRVARLVLLPVTLYFLLFAPAARRQSTRYLRRALGREPRWRDSWRHFHAFASVALDRVWFARGDTARFDIRRVDSELVERAVDEGRGACLVGAHFGSFEALHAVGTQTPGMHVAMVMYPHNARLIHRALAAVAPDFGLDIIAIGTPGSTLAIRDWLDSGGLAGLLADRSAGVGGAGTVVCSFLGRDAPFTDGPFRLAMLLRRRVIFMVAIYGGGNRYEIRFDEIADFRHLPRAAGEREALARAAVARYAARLEALCREAPGNWFNFHDFWHEDRAA